MRAPPRNPPDVVDRLCRQWLPLSRRVAHDLARWLGPEITYHCLGVEELEREAEVGLWYAAESYDPARGAQFQTHAWGVIRRHLLRYVQRHRRQKRMAKVCHLDRWDELPQRAAPVGPLTRVLLESALALLPGDERRAVLLLVCDGRTLDEAGAEMGLSRDQARARRERGLARLREEMAS